MARLLTFGAEWGNLEAWTANGAIASNVNPRSGTYALRQTTNNAAQSAPGFSGSLNISYFVRAYIYLSALPAVLQAILAFNPGGISNPICAIEPDGTIILKTGNTQIGSASLAVTPGSYFMLELMTQITSGLDIAEARLNGVSFAQSSSISISASAPTGIFAGYSDGTITTDYDDIAVNDSTGSNQTSWPNNAKIVLLRPISDNARGTNWVGGAAGTTNLWDAINNTPPVGVATASGTNTSQIHNVTKDTTGNYDANLTTYTTAGITANDAITVVHPTWNIGGAATGDAMLLVSNPQANAGVESTASPGTTLGIYPTGWVWEYPSAQIVYNPSVTLGTSPVIRIGKRQSSTNEVGCDAMGVYVEYISGSFDRKLVKSRALEYANRQRTIDF